MDHIAIGQAAVDVGLGAGADNVEFRFQTVRTREVETHNQRPTAIHNSIDEGVAVRVLSRGAWGVASTTQVDQRGVQAATRHAMEMAEASRSVQRRPVELAPEPGHGEIEWSSPCRINPLEVAVTDVVARLSDWSDQLLDHPAITDVHARVAMRREESVIVTSAGTAATQTQTQVHPLVHVMAADPATGESCVGRSLGPPTCRGWEYLDGEGWDWESEWASLGDGLAELVRAPDVQPGAYDLVIAPSNLWLTLHETVGHATELDRMLGYEQGFAGTTFVQPTDLGRLRYGSPLMNVVADRTTPHGLATAACDQEGVLAQEWSLISAGVLHGAQSDRASAAEAAQSRSTGCSAAESPTRTQVARMANVSLQPAPDGPSLPDMIADVDDGFLLIGSNSWSIDMDRRDFQFTAQRWHKIEAGRIVGQVRNAAYRGQTLDFWNSLESVGNPDTFEIFGADLCGKAQPVQAAGASHGAPITRFSQVQVSNTRGDRVQAS